MIRYLKKTIHAITYKKFNQKRTVSLGKKKTRLGMSLTITQQLV